MPRVIRSEISDTSASGSRKCRSNAATACGRAEASTDVAKLSIVGVAVGSTPGVAGTMFAAVSGVGANIEMIATSEVRVSVVIPARFAQDALKAVHHAFDLDVADGDA